MDMPPSTVNPNAARVLLTRNKGNYRKTARDLGIAPNTLYRICPLDQEDTPESQAVQVFTPDQTEPFTYPSHPNTPQTQDELIASERDQMPGKQDKIRLAEAAFLAYGMKSLELVDETRSPEMAAKVAKSWFDTLSLLVEGRHKQPSVTTEQHIHTGPEYHRAAASNAAKHPKHRRKQQ